MIFLYYKFLLSWAYKLWTNVNGIHTNQQAERDSLSAQLLTAMEGTAQWERKEAALEVQLVEVPYCAVL